MVNYKVILDDKRVNSTGKYPVVIRITFNRRNTSYITGVRVQKHEWDQRSQQITKAHGNHQQLNKSIGEFYLKVQKAIHRLTDTGHFSFEQLKEDLKDKPLPTVFPGNFKDFSDKLIKEMIAVKRSGNAIVYQTAVNKLISFAGNKNIKFNEINYSFLDDFKYQMILNGARVNTVGNYFRSIRAIYNKAIKAKLVDRACYPFHDISIKQERTIKRAIMIDDIYRVVALEIKPNTPMWHARNYFLLSFSLIGISFTDLAYIKQENIVRDRVEFTRRKTHKRYSIKITSYTKNLFDIYKRSNSTYLLPILPFQIDEDSLDAKKRITQALRITNKYLKRLGTECGLVNPLTTYVARHTWATTAKRLGYSNELIAEAMGHEYGNKITNIYLDNFEQNVIDDLNEKVIDTIINLK